MRVLIAIPRIYDHDGFYYFPLGIMYISSYLKKAGFDVCCVDFNKFPSGNPGEVIKKYMPFDIFATGSLSTHFTTVEKYVNCVKELSPKTKIILGGALATADPEYVLREIKPDYLVLGEGEQTVVALLEALDDGSRTEDIPGVACLRKGEFISNGRGPLIENLDALPFPDWEGFGLQEFLDNNIYDLDTQPREESMRMFYVSGSRGCIGKCTFCFRVMGDGAYRMRSVESLIKEVKLLISRYGVNYIMFNDELFSNDRERVVNFCHEMKKLGIKWAGAGYRANQGDPELYTLLREAGCKWIGPGLESASHAVLKSMKKGVSPERAERFLVETRQSGLWSGSNFIFGDPAETMNTFRQTMKMFRKMRSFSLNLMYVHPYPGTSLFERCFADGIFTDKRQYYDKIVNSGRDSKGRRLNMTKMSMTEFETMGAEIVVASMENQVFGRIINKKKRKELVYDIEVTCPICSNDNRYTNKSVDSQFIKVDCRFCNQMYEICRLDFDEFYRPWKQWQDSLEAIREKSQPVIVTPALRKEYFDFFYKKDFSGLNIKYFADISEEKIGLKLNGVEIKCRNQELVSENKEAIFMVLRGFELNDSVVNIIAGHLRELGVEDERILQAIGEPVDDGYIVPEEHMVDGRKFFLNH